MKWKDILIGAIVTLFVTVLAGVAVYYFTKEPELRSRDQLTYVVRSGGHFSGETQEVGFATVEISNSGEKPAEQAQIFLDFAAPVVRDVSIDAPEGMKYSQKLTDKSKISISIERLLPNEKVAVNALVSSSARPKVSGRTSTSIAIPANSLAPESTDRQKIFNKIAALSVPLSVLFFSILTTKFLKGAKKYRITQGIVPDRNNAAFLLLHNGLIDDAITILNSSIKSGRYDSFTFSNLSLCYRIRGETIRGDALAKAATFRDKEGHEKAVIEFNNGIYSLLSGNRDQAIQHFKTAVSASSKEIKLYAKKSIHLDPYRGDQAFMAEAFGA